MFGFGAISRTPFTSLPGNSFAFNRIEGFTVESDGTQGGDFYFAIVENADLSDLLDNHADMLLGINEDSVTEDASTMLAALLQAIDETLTSADSRAIFARFRSSIVENNEMESVESNGAVVYFSIEENSTSADTRLISAGFTQSPNENLDSAAVQTITAQFAVNKDEAAQITEHLEFYGWVKMIVGNDPNWVPVDDSQ